MLANDDFYTRWRMLTTNLYHMGAMMNPYLLVDLSIHEDVAVKSRFLNVMCKLTTSIDNQYGRMVANFQAFKDR
jgi:hypothetical protein